MIFNGEELLDTNKINSWGDQCLRRRLLDIEFVLLTSVALYWNLRYQEFVVFGHNKSADEEESGRNEGIRIESELVLFDFRYVIFIRLFSLAWYLFFLWYKFFINSHDEYANFSH